MTVSPVFATDPASRPFSGLRAGLVIFDCDGVLIDSEPVSSRHFSRHLARFGLEITPDEVHERFTGYSGEDAIAILREDYGIDRAEDIQASGQAELYAMFRAELQPVAGMETLIGALIGTGQPCDARCRRICVASNSSVERLDHSLGLTPLRQFFGNHVYSAQMVARPKPAPDLIEHCLRQFDADAAEAVMIDDNPQGILAARAAGVAAIGFITPGDHRPGRAALLLEAGAFAVAGSAEALQEILG